MSAFRFHVVILLVMLATAIRNAQAQPTTPKPLVPLAIGNTWTYRVIEPTKEGTGTDTASLVITVVNRVVVDRETWWIVHYYDPAYGNDKPYLERWTNRPDGFVTSSDGRWAANLYPYPAKVGDVTKADTSVTKTVLAIDYPTAVPAGVFPCYLYQLRLTPRTHTLSAYAPGVGMVRWEYRGPLDVWALRELVEFRPGAMESK